MSSPAPNDACSVAAAITTRKDPPPVPPNQPNSKKVKSVISQQDTTEPHVHSITLSQPLAAEISTLLPSAETAGLVQSPFDNVPVDMLEHILSFVGQGYYLSIAKVNRSFNETYTKLFRKRTYLTASSEEYARFCWNELDPGSNQEHGTLCMTAAYFGNLPALQYLRSVECRWDQRTCASAAVMGHLDVLQWCREHECPWDERTCEHAAGNGHLQIIQWCQENGCPWDETTCTAAARFGHMETLRWCREHGCPWNERTCSRAALHGQLQVLQWCRANGCPWDEKTALYAALNGHLHVLQWYRENGGRWDKDTCAAAAKHGHLKVLKWCRDHGCRWNEKSCFNAAKEGHLEVLKWCRKNGCSWNAGKCHVRAVILCRWDVAKWIQENSGLLNKNSHRNWTNVYSPFRSMMFGDVGVEDCRFICIWSAKLPVSTLWYRCLGNAIPVRCLWCHIFFQTTDRISTTQIGDFFWMSLLQLTTCEVCMTSTAPANQSVRLKKDIFWGFEEKEFCRLWLGFKSVQNIVRVEPPRSKEGCNFPTL